jgi:hypothetical protein
VGTSISLLWRRQRNGKQRGRREQQAREGVTGSECSTTEDTGQPSQGEEAKQKTTDVGIAAALVFCSAAPFFVCRVSHIPCLCRELC